MQEIRRFWQSLERIAGCATVGADWTRLMGEEYALTQRFFRPSDELATFFPHEDPELLIYRVVTHGPDDHVGICDETGERVVLATADLIIQELDWWVLGRDLAEAFGFCHVDRPVDHLVGTRRIGEYVPLAGFRFPAFVSIRTSGFQQVVDRLLATRETPFLLLAPTRHSLGPVGEESLRRRRACFLSLEETTGVDERGRLVATEAGQRAIEAFRREVVPENRQAEEGLAFFPTPPGATWSQVKLRLLDGHTVSIDVGAARGVYTYSQIGMANRKNGAPSVQWELLSAFASGHGLLTWRSPKADRRNQKRRENLARCLRSFFRIDQDPFVPFGDGWRARFSITDDI